MSPSAACPPRPPSTGPPAQPGGGQRVEQPPGGLEFGPRACHWAGRACGDHLLSPASASRESLTQAWQLLRDRQVGAHPRAYGRMDTGRCILHIYPGGDIRAACTVVPRAIHSPRARVPTHPREPSYSRARGGAHRPWHTRMRAHSFTQPPTDTRPSYPQPITTIPTPLPCQSRLRHTGWLMSL